MLLQARREGKEAERGHLRGWDAEQQADRDEERVLLRVVRQDLLFVPRHRRVAEHG